MCWCQEFFPEEFKVLPTEVDPNGLERAFLVASGQERAGTNSQARVDKIYELYEDGACNRPILGPT
jgi:hypothetical protein